MLFFPEFAPPTVEDLPKDVDETGGLAAREKAAAERKKAILDHMKNCTIVGNLPTRGHLEGDPDEDEDATMEEDGGGEEYEP